VPDFVQRRLRLQPLLRRGVEASLVELTTPKGEEKSFAWSRPVSVTSMTSTQSRPVSARAVLQEWGPDVQP
jgi:hypothetical protein